MSAYKLFESVQFANAQLLISALREMGYEPQVGEAIQLRGWGKQTAQIVVPREQGESAYYDMGFVWKDGAYVPVIESGDSTRAYGTDWRYRLQALYAKLAALTFLTRMQADVGQVQTLPDGTLSFSATMEVKVR